MLSSVSSSSTPTSDSPEWRDGKYDGGSRDPGPSEAPDDCEPCEPDRLDTTGLRFDTDELTTNFFLVVLPLLGLLASRLLDAVLLLLLPPEEDDEGFVDFVSRWSDRFVSVLPVPLPMLPVTVSSFALVLAPECTSFASTSSASDGLPEGSENRGVGRGPEKEGLGFRRID